MADDFELEQMLSYRISKLFSRSSAAASRDIAGLGMALREWRVIALIGDRAKMRATDLVERSLMDKASVSRAVAALVQRGLLASEPDPADGRVQRLSLTSAGRALRRKMVPRSLSRNRAMLQALDPADRKALIRILDKLTARLDQLASKR